jgi:hypothetical protein
LSAAVAAGSIGLALVSGSHRRAALVGALTASLTGLLSLLAMTRAAGAGRLVQRALVVMVVAFLVRILLVAGGTALVARGGEDVVAYVVAFFVPYFIFAAIEGAYLHSLSRETGPTA